MKTYFSTAHQKKNINQEVLNNMTRLLEAIHRGILRGLNEQNIELLADLDGEQLDQLDSLQTKSFNDKIDGSIMAVRQQVKQQLLYAIQTCKLPSGLKRIINDPINFSKFKWLIKANDTTHLKQLIKIGQALFGNNGNFNWIDTSKIADMSNLFYYNSYFNGHIELWDVSNVTNMYNMFAFAEKFNQPIGDWDVSNVINMGYMFHHADKFNQPIGDWNVSNVTNMDHMFCRAEKFNQPAGDWDVSNVTTMEGMFCYAYKFNKPIRDWDVSNVINMEGMFWNAFSFNQDISSWNVKNVKYTSIMYPNCPIKEKYKPKFK